MQLLNQLTPKIISIAPMMGWTNPSMQKITNIIAPNMIFYSQMYHIEAIIRRPELLQYEPKNLIIQLGGSCPEKFFLVGRILKERHIKNININVGCPSNKVQKGNFGACLMREPELVSDCLNALSESHASHYLSVKCRIGIDKEDSESFLNQFIETIATKANIQSFIIHARKAWLSGLNPKQNREIPPLNYDRVYQIKQKYPHLKIGINGGINNIKDISNHLKICDEVMLGRLLLNDLYKVHEIDAHFFNYKPLSRGTLIEQIKVYDNSMSRFLQSLFKGMSGCKKWRKTLPNINHYEELMNLNAKMQLLATQEVR